MSRKLAFSALGILAVLLAMEGASFVLVSLKLHRISLARTLFADFVPEEKLYGDCEWAERVVLHPYLAYHYHSYEPCRLAGINELGFVGDAIPPRRDPARFTILLLGGSVAEQLMVQRSAAGKPLLEERLNRAFFSPNGRPFRVLNAAVAAGQQPMEAISFQLFGDRADAVMSLEGYNENSQFRIGMPLEDPPHIWFQLAQLQSGDPWKILRRRLARENYLSLRRSPLLSRSYTAFLAAYTWLLLEEPPANTSTDLSSVFPYPPEFTREEKNKLFVESYRKYLTDIIILARNRGMPVAFFLQPVPALFKQITTQERQVVGDLSYGRFYQDMIHRLETGEGPKLPLIELLDILRDVTDTVYVDPIHFTGNGKGYPILADAIVAQLGKTWHLKPR